MNYVALGLMFSEKSFSEACTESKCGIQIATHSFQNNLFSGFENVANFSIINTVPIGSYPIHSSRLLVKEKSWGISNTEIPFINLPIIKRLFHEVLSYKEIKKRIIVGEETSIIVYSLYKPFLRAAKRIKNRFPKINICLIQTDAIPGRNGMKKYTRIWSKVEGDNLVKLAKECDSFVILSKHLVQPLEIENRPYIIVESVCDESQKISCEKKVSSNVCLYTGALEKEYGIADLVEAFKLIPNGELWICGAGELDEYIRNKCIDSNNIKYYGFLTKSQVEDLRNNCDFLINPRRPNGTYTMYSFPSKTTEYLMSAKPTIMYKLEGIPDEYDEYINYLSGDNPIKIAGELNNIFELNYNNLLKKAKQGRNFIRNNKNGKLQASRIRNLICNSISYQN